MLLSVLYALRDVESLGRVNDANLVDNYYIVTDKELELKGWFFGLAEQTIFVVNTYNLEDSLLFAKKLDEGFQVFNISKDLFLKWFSLTSNQVVECEYSYKGVERRSTAFNLKGLETFVRRLQESEIKSITFFLEKYDVIITARKEGRISISPSIEDSKMIEIFKLLLDEGIKSLVR